MTASSRGHDRPANRSLREVPAVAMVRFLSTILNARRSTSGRIQCPRPSRFILQSIKASSQDPPTSRGGTLKCKCATNPVVVEISGQICPQPCLRLHSMLEAGRSRVLCRRRDPEGQASREGEPRTSSPSSIRQQRSSATPANHAASICMDGSKTRSTLSTGSTKYTPELSSDSPAGPPLSLPPSCRRSSNPDPSPDKMPAVRAQLKTLGLEPYDLSVASDHGRDRDAQREAVRRPAEISRRRSTHGGGLRNGAPDKIRTCDLCLRRATLYPAELRAPSPSIAEPRRSGNGVLSPGPRPAL